MCVGNSGFRILVSRRLAGAVGLYGVSAYSTETRTREIGVRLALGAARYKLLRMVVSEMVWIVSVASLVAILGIAALAHPVQSQLYEIRALDPETLLFPVALTAIFITLAAVLPARRVTSVNPVDALRSE